jgi:hypothetical protein
MGTDASFGGSNALIWILDQRVVTGECNFTSNHSNNNMTVGRMTKLRSVKRVTRLGGRTGKGMTITKQSVLRRVAVGDDHGDCEVEELVS